MKVVLFCGGLGMRMRGDFDRVPKPMVPIGEQPILMHVMKYYAHYGHSEFIICLGYKGRMIKEYFLSYNEALSNDFVFSEGGRTMQLIGEEIRSWKITFVDTGQNASIGERLRKVRPYIGNDPLFLANYADGLTDLDLNEMIGWSQRSGKIATMLCVQPKYSFHVVAFDDNRVVSDIRPLTESNIWINGGYFVFRDSVFDYIAPDEELVEAPFRRLIVQGQLAGYPHEGFWTTMDTFKDQQRLEALHETGEPPWAVWNRRAARASESGLATLGWVDGPPVAPRWTPPGA